MLKLVSFTTCPFVQRAVLMLREKGVPFDIEYIDLRNRPAWFVEKSPRGKVPIVILDDGAVLFESAAICEYLEETVPTPPLHPGDAVGRARDRAWFAFAGEDLFLPLYRFETASTEAAAKEARGGIEKALARLESELAGRAFLSGDGTRFGMADVALAPALYRLDVLKREHDVDMLAATPNVAAWSARVLGRPTVPASVPPSWSADHRAHLAAMGSLLVAPR